MRWAIALTACALFSTAHADTESAKAHYKKGLSAYALGRFKDAATEYETAFDLEPDPALLYNAAQAHRLAGNKERALLLYENYLRLFPDRPNERDVHRYIRSLKEAIEGDARAKAVPPVDPMTPNGATTPSPEPAPRQSTTVFAPTTDAQLTASAPPAKKTRRWVWGVVGGVVGVVVVGAAIGLSIGLSGTHYPHPGIGTVTLQ